MRLPKWWWFAGAALAAGLAVAAWPAVARSYRIAGHRYWLGEVSRTYAALRNRQEGVRLPRREKDADEARAPGLRRDEADDATVRRLATLARWGYRDQVFNQKLLDVAAAEARRWGPHGPRSRWSGALQPNGELNPIDTAQSWVSVGPANSRFEIGVDGSVNNGSTGRITGIETDPRDSRILYVSAAGGGVWKTYDITAEPAVWIPTTDSLGNLAVGAMCLDPQHPDTVWAGLGDAYDENSGLLIVSHDGGGSWSAPIALSALQPLDGRQGTAGNIRDIRVDPTNSKHVLVTTDVGLFVSQDGATFSLATLPTGGVSLEAATWSLVYLGQAQGVPQWLVSGVLACAEKSDPPTAGSGLPLGFAKDCALGNLGDIWRSTDNGLTWGSLRVAGKLPTFNAMDGDFGRPQLGAGDTSDPAHTVVYAQVGTVDEGGANTGAATLAVLRSADGGASFTVAARYDTAVTNPTQGVGFPGGMQPGDCTTVNLGHGQSWYNLTIVVDPANSNNVLAGGNFCAARSTDGGLTWTNVSHWQPGRALGMTADGALPYVHADWHVLRAVRHGAAYTLFAGTDGGLVSSSNVFEAPATGVVWSYPDAGLVTHLTYSVGSGDPVDGNAGTIVTGMQDNGSRVRDGEKRGAGVFFNAVLGGDGVGSTVSNDGASPARNVTLWASNPNDDRHFCPVSAGNCNTTSDQSNSPWDSIALPLPGASTSNGDSDPFFISYSPINDSAGSVLTGSSLNVWKIDGNKKVTLLTPNGFTVGMDQGNVTSVIAAPGTYTLGGQPARLYAATLQSGRYAIGADVNGAVTWTLTATPTGIGSLDSQRIGLAASVAFPSKATNFGAGRVDGATFIAASASPYLFDGSPVPDAIGHLFLTGDTGTTWTPLHGNGAGFDLPNVPINVVKLDPGDPTDHTIYVGCEIGVYRSTDLGQTWLRVGVGLPMVKVTDLFIAKNSSLLRVSTYGRGLWEIYPNADAGRGVAGDGDWDHNGYIDFFDLAALATRLGTTPATTAAPYYDWNSDLIGEANAIDESDLTALLPKVGSHP